MIIISWIYAEKLSNYIICHNSDIIRPFVAILIKSWSSFINILQVLEASGNDLYWNFYMLISDKVIFSLIKSTAVQCDSFLFWKTELHTSVLYSVVYAPVISVVGMCMYYTVPWWMRCGVLKESHYNWDSPIADNKICLWLASGINIQHSGLY